MASLDLSNFDTRNVERMNNMFSGCSSLTSLDISNFETYNLENMNEMFSNCSCLKYLDISGFSGEASSNGLLSGVPMSGQVKVSKRFAEKIKKYTPKKWVITLIDG